MLPRREFLKQSVVVATVASTGMLSAEADSPAPSLTAAPRDIDFVLFDADLEDSVVFARELTARGARSFATENDLGQLWFGELGRAFAAGRSIAGLTSHSELLICASFARDAGARLRYEGAHDCRGCNELTHSLQLPADAPSLGAALAAADADWPRIVASHAPVFARSRGALREHRCPSAATRSATHPGSLFSWVIA